MAGITADQLRDHLGIDPADTADAAWLEQCVAAVNAWVATLPVAVGLTDWTPDVITGTVLLAAHLYHSRNAPYGRATLDLAGGFNQAYADPEIARYLRLRRWAKPMISGPA